MSSLVLLPLGLLVGLVVMVRSHLWLGLILLPVALALGFSTAIVLAG